MKTVTETRRCSARDTFLAESVHLVLMNIRSWNLWSPLRLPLPMSPRRLQSSFGRFDPLLFRQCPIFYRKFARIFVCRVCPWVGSETVAAGHLLDSVQWCACAFPNSLSTYENGLNTSPLREAVRQLVGFGISQQFALE